MKSLFLFSAFFPALFLLFLPAAHGQNNVLCGERFNMSTVAKRQLVSIWSHKGVVNGGTVFQEYPYYCNHTIIMGPSCSKWTFYCPEFKINSRRVRNPKNGKYRCVGDQLTVKARGSNKNYGSGCATRAPPFLRNKNNRVLKLSMKVRRKPPASRPGYKCQIKCTQSDVPVRTANPEETPGQCYCGLPHRRRRIIGGVATEKNEYRWQVGIVARNTTSGEFLGKPYCGGTLINDQFVITAAHCLESWKVPTASSIGILLGEHDLTTDQEINHIEAEVESFGYDPGYNSYTTERDYGWVKLASPINFTEHEHIRPACPPVKRAVDLVGMDGVLTGWGTTISGHTGSQANVLLESTQTVLSHEQCTTNAVSNNHYDPTHITSHMFCAFAKGKDSCQGDSGGPFVTKSKPETPFDVYYLSGITSWGFGCGSFPGVYSDVEAVWDEIFMDQIGGGNFCDDPTEIR